MNELGEAFKNAMNSLAEISFKKDAFNGAKRNHYITLDAINIQLLPRLRENSLSFIVHRDPEQNFWGTLTHMPTLQEYSKCFGRIELSNTGRKSDGSEYQLMNSAQAQGASLSYGRRYVTACFFNLLIDVDTDGEVQKGQVKEHPKLHEKVNDFKDRVKGLVQKGSLKPDQGAFWINQFEQCKSIGCLQEKGKELALVLNPAKPVANKIQEIVKSYVVSSREDEFQGKLKEFKDKIENLIKEEKLPPKEGLECIEELRKCLTTVELVVKWSEIQKFLESLDLEETLKETSKPFDRPVRT